MKKTLRSSPNKREQRTWTTGEAMLLLQDLKTGLKTVNAMLGGWFEARRELKFNHKWDGILMSMSITQVHKLWTQHSEDEVSNIRDVLAYTRAMGIASVGDLWIAETRWSVEEEIQG